MKERAPTTTDSISEESFGEDAKRLATILTASPNLRAKLFANPTKVVGKQIPRRKYWHVHLLERIRLREPEDRRVHHDARNREPFR